jgi:hypothetical protein
MGSGRTPEVNITVRSKFQWHIWFCYNILRPVSQWLWYIFFVLWWKCSCMIYANFNILVVVYLWLLIGKIGTPLMFAPVVKE